MFKSNYYHLLFLSALFCANSVNVFCSSSSSTYHHPENSVDIRPLFSIGSSVTPQHNNAYFNGSTNTFILPFMLADGDPNNSTAVFDQDSYLADHITDYNNTNVDHLISDESILSNTTDPIPSVVPQQMQQAIYTAADHNQQSLYQPYSSHLSTVNSMRANNENYNPNSNNNYNHDSQQYQKHNINRPIAILNSGMNTSVNLSNNNTSSVVPQQMQQAIYTAADHNQLSLYQPHSSYLSTVNSMRANNGNYNPNSNNNYNHDSQQYQKHNINRPIAILNSGMNTSVNLSNNNTSSVVPQQMQQAIYTAADHNQQSLYQPYSSHLSTVNLTNKHSITLPIAPSNTYSHNCPSVVTNTNCNVTSQSYFGGFQTNGNCNPNKNNNYNHNSNSYMISTLGKTKTQFNYHKKKHSKDHKCPNCSKGFFDKNALNNHIRTHTGEKPFKCNRCSGNKGFKTKSNLNRHIRTVHEKIRPHQCDFCNKRFTEKGNLEKHKRIHRGEKPFECKKCNKRFTEKGNLTQHIKRHNKEKRFKCTGCSMRFVTNSEMTIHYRTHTGERPFECGNCDKCFIDRGGLSRHIKKQHPIGKV